MHNVTPIAVPASLVEETLRFLRDAGAARHSEGVVLWLGKRAHGTITVCEAFVPEQIAARDSFRIPPAAMSALLRHLGDTRTFIAAQVHSHPNEAFHSRADDLWAIVRHVGALSIVVPEFARAMSVGNMLEESAVFCLSPNDTWKLVLPPNLLQVVTIA